MRPRGPRKRFLNAALFLLALPGLFFLVRDVLRPSRAAIADRACVWREHALEAAEEFDLDVNLILAVIAVESKGDPEAVSSAGARGLMQLMPATARETARWIGLPEPDPEDLSDGCLNVRLGSAYLREQLDSFGGDPALALAAYNAGPGNLDGWISAEPEVSSREALDRRGFPGTKAYVRNVLKYRELLTETDERN